MGCTRENSNRGGGDTFVKPSLEFFIFLIYPWKCHKIVLDSLEIPRPKAKTHGNSTLYFLSHPWKFHFIFNLPLEITRAISLIPLEIPYPQSPCLDFSGIAQLHFILHLAFFYYLPINNYC